MYFYSLHTLPRPRELGGGRSPPFHAQIQGQRATLAQKPLHRPFFPFLGSEISKMEGMGWQGSPGMEIPLRSTSGHTLPDTILPGPRLNQCIKTQLLPLQRRRGAIDRSMKPQRQLRKVEDVECKARGRRSGSHVAHGLPTVGSSLVPSMRQSLLLHGIRQPAALMPGTAVGLVSSRRDRSYQ